MSLIKQEMPAFASEAESAEASVYRKVSWRLLPFLGVLWVLAWLDRVNIGLRNCRCWTRCISAKRCTDSARASSFWATFCSKCRRICYCRRSARRRPSCASRSAGA